MQKGDKYLVKLGKDLLERNMKEESVISSSIADSSGEIPESIYLDTIKLVKLLKEIKENGNVQDSHRQQIIAYIKDIVNDLDETTNGPALQISSGPTILNAYRVISYAFLFIENNFTQSETLNDSTQEFERIKDKYKELKGRYAELQTKYDALIRESDFEDRSSIIEAKSISLESDMNALEQQNEQLKRELEESRNANEAYNELLGLLKSRFNLPSYATTDSIITKIKDDNERQNREKYDSESDNQAELIKQELEKEKEEKEKLLNEIESLKQDNKNLKAQLESSNNANDELNNQMKDLRSQISELSQPNTSDAKIFVLETDLHAQKIKYNELQEDYNKKKEKNRNLQVILSQLKDECKNKQIEYETLQMKNDKLQVDVDELKAKLLKQESNSASINEIESKGEENRKLHEALYDIAEQLEIVTSDLSKENESKNHLVELLHRQSSALSEAEQQIKNIKKESSDKDARLKQLQTKLDEMKESIENADCASADITKELCQYTSANVQKSELQSQMLLILSEDKDLVSRLVELINLLISHQKIALIEKTKSSSEKELQEQNSRLLLYISNLVHFVDQVANSSDVQDWFVESAQSYEVRTRLIAQVTKVEAFLKSNGLSTSEQKLCDSYAHFPSFIKKLIEESDIASAEDIQEIKSINEQFALANSILVKYSNELQQRGNVLISDMKSMKNELTKANEITANKIEEATCELENRLQDIQYERDDLKDKLKRIQNELRKAGNNSNSNIKCLNIINGNNNSCEEDEEEEVTQEVYIKALEGKVEQLVAELEHVNELHDNETENLNQRLDILSKEYDAYKESAETTQNEIQSQNQSLSNQISRLLENKTIIEEKLNEVNENNKQLHDVLEEQTKQMDEFNKVREQERESIIKDYEEKKEEQEQIFKSQIDELNKELADKDEQMKEQVYQIKQCVKEDIKRMKNEIDIQTRRASEIRGNYEPILADLRSKLTEARKNETSARDELLKASSEVKDVKSQLATSRVDNKMLKMKINAAEEKLKREKSLIDTQYKMKILQIETDNQANIDKVKQSLISAQHVFLVSICERFKDFVDFSQSINEESVSSLLDRVSTAVDKSSSRFKDLERFYAEINQIRSILNIDQSASLLQPITELVQKNSQYESEKEKLESEKADIAKALKQTRKLAKAVSSANEWEEWSRRLYSIITDNFATVKNVNETRHALEEALMSSIGQRQMWRHMDILRTEKALYASGLVNANQKSHMKPTFTSVLASVISLLRIQKSSGHMKCTISMPRIEKSPSKSSDSQQLTPKKKWPILSSI